MRLTSEAWHQAVKSQRIERSPRPSMVFQRVKKAEGAQGSRNGTHEVVRKAMSLMLPLHTTNHQCTLHSAPRNGHTSSSISTLPTPPLHANSLRLRPAQAPRKTSSTRFPSLVHLHRKMSHLTNNASVSSDHALLHDHLPER